MKYFFILFISTFVFSCDKETVQSATDPQTISDAEYGSDPKQKMDIYLPANRNTKDTKLIILIHGGGWTDGDKVDFNPVLSELRSRFPEWAIANINYRLFSNNKNLFPTQENDVKAAVDFLAANASEYKISTDMALIGASAGAHLALLHSYKYNDNRSIKAVVSLFGPTELVSLYNNPPSPPIPLLLSSVLGGNPNTASALYQSSSPYNYVSGLSSPTILFHGGIDPLVPASQSVMLRDKLKANGVTNEYVFYPTEGHGWSGANLVDTFNKIQAFLQSEL